MFFFQLFSLLTWCQCDNEATKEQTIRFNDHQAPTLVGKVPASSITLTCNDPFPETSNLTYNDNCGQNFTVEPRIFLHKGDSVCTGQKTRFLWEGAGATDACGNQAQDIVQEITVLDDSPPNFTASKLEDIRLLCPSDYSPENLSPPKATDDCAANVTVTAEVSEFDGCKTGRIITWTAEDECKKTSKIYQHIKFSDSEPPILKGIPPNDTIVGCKDPFPEAKTLKFADICAGTVDVSPTDTEDKDGDVCVGKETERVWIGASDKCENKAPDVTQIITVKDLSAPNFTRAKLDDAYFTCPSDFDTLKLDVPGATGERNK